MKKYRIYIIPLLALNFIFFMSGKNDQMRKLFLVSEFNFNDSSLHHRYGDLYRLSKVDNFLETLSVNHVRYEEDSPSSSDVLLAGDSYFGSSIGGEFISTDLEKQYGLNVFDISNVNIGSANDPIGAIKDLKLDKSKSRILVLQTTERFSVGRALYQYLKREAPVEQESDELTIFLYKVFLNRQFFIEHNKLIYPVIRFKNTLNFRLFKQIDINIGAYSEDPPMLFYRQDLLFANRTRTPEQLDLMANNIELVRNKLKNDYNITMLYIIIPDKYSVYNDLVSGQYKYSGYIYEIQRRLEEKNVNILDIFSVFMDFKKKHPDKILYTMSDSHFNAVGKTIFLEELAKKINEIRN